MHFSGPGMTPHGYYDQSGYEPSPSSTGSAGMHYIDSLLTISPFPSYLTSSQNKVNFNDIFK